MSRAGSATILCACLASVLLVIGAVRASPPLDSTQLLPFTCQDKHKTEVLFRCTHKATDAATGRELCMGDAFLTPDGTVLSDGYDPCLYSTCLGVGCQEDAQVSVLQMYDEGHPFYNSMRGRDECTESFRRCMCSSLDGTVVMPIEKVFPDGAEYQQHDPVCAGLTCAAGKFLLTYTGSPKDCECCDPQIAVPAIYPPGCTDFPGCTGSAIPVVPQPTTAAQFAAAVRGLCPGAGGGIGSYSDDELLEAASSFCCARERQVEHCGMQVVHMGQTGSGDVQCNFAPAGAAAPISCCGTMDASGAAANKGTLCQDSALGVPSARTAAGIMAAAVLLFLYAL